MVLERKELPKIKEDEEIMVCCEVCGAVLRMPQEKAVRRCSRCLQQT